MKLTKSQIHLLEQKLIDLEDERKYFWIGSAVIYIAIFALGHYFLQWNINVEFIIIWGGIMIAISSWQKSKLDKEAEETKFKLAGTKSWEDKRINEEFDKVWPKIQKEQEDYENKYGKNWYNKYAKDKGLASEKEIKNLVKSKKRMTRKTKKK